MSEAYIRKVKHELAEEYSVAMVESFTPLEGRVVTLDDRLAIADYLEEKEHISYTVNGDLWYSDGDIQGVPIRFELEHYFCSDCDRIWMTSEGPYETGLPDGEEGPQEHEFRTGHLVMGL